MSATMPATRRPTPLSIDPGPQGLDAESISQNTETHEEKTPFTPWDNQSARSDHEGQSEIR